MELLHTDTLEEAREKLKLQTADFKLRTYAVSCADSLGCICGEDVTAGENVPPFRYTQNREAFRPLVKPMAM